MILLVKLFHLILILLLFNMRKIQVTFSLTLILKVRILDITKRLKSRGRLEK